MAWEPPIGIPDVPAGLEPDQAQPSNPANWPSAAQSGYYYIDNTHGSATDSGNPNGYPNLPRLTLPANGTSYTMIKIVGGGSNYSITTRTWTATGSSQGSMAAVIGVNDPVISGTAATLSFAGSWVLVDGLDCVNVRLSAAGINLDNALLRNNTVRDWAGSTNSPAFGMAYSGDGQTPYNENIVIYNNTVSGWGDMEAVGEVDNLGVVAGDGARNWWVVDNDMGGINGDSIRTGTNVGGGHDPNRAENIYIGRNHFYENGENAIDVKNSVNVIISENVLHGFPRSAAGSSAGEAIVIHEQAENTAIICNTIYDCQCGVSPSSGGQTNVWIVGNIFYDIDGSGDPNTLATAGTAVNWSAMTGASVMVGNTFHDNDRDINIEVSSATASYVISNNLFVGTKSTGAHIGFENGSASLTSSNAVISHNMFQTGASSAVLQVSSTQYATLAAAMSAFSGRLVSCVEGDTAVTNAAAQDYTLTSDSDAIGVGASDPQGVYAALATEFGTTFTFDRAGLARPQGGSWDIGAYEFVEASAPETPPLRVLAFSL